MSSVTANQTVVVLDTNIIVSALVFGGLPGDVLTKILENEVMGIVSRPLVAECLRILREKFHFAAERIEETQEMFDEHFLLVYPKDTITVVIDDPDNRVLEAAVEGDCDFIVTGDKLLLKLGVYKKIKIITAADFILL